MKVNVLLLGGLVAPALAAPAGHVVHEKRQEQDGLHIVKDVDANTTLAVRIALKQNGLDEGAEQLFDISDPDSKNYGKHLSRDDIIKMFAADDKNIESVKAWIKKGGISADTIHVPESKIWVNFNATASQLESMLNAKYHVYSVDDSQDGFVGTSEYHLPTDISDVVDFVSPGVATNLKITDHVARIPEPRIGIDGFLDEIKANPDTLEICDKIITPACIRAMYNITEGKYADSSNRLGLFQALGEQFSQTDLDGLYGYVSPDISKGTGPVVSEINGAVARAQGKAGSEVTLDLDMAIPLIYPQSTEIFQLPETLFRDIFDDFLDAIDSGYCTWGSLDCGKFKPTNVISVSYGADENGDTVAHRKRQCNEYMKLGLLGVTTFFSSGDSGVASRGQSCLGRNSNIFIPGKYPSCPYVTAVGSTTLKSGRRPGDDEIATDQFSSGGGFSNIFARPQYQKTAVESYFQDHDPGYRYYSTKNSAGPPLGTNGIYNRAGRGYPDLSAVGLHGLMVFNGATINGGGGTSMSAPIVASIFNLINEERKKAGKGPVGFINPTIYKHPEAFNDITVGDQSRGGQASDAQPSECGNKGFSAVKGWDPVTGLGTPNYSKLLDIFMNI